MEREINSAVILCKNGLGHTKRTGIIINELIKRNTRLSTVIICSKQQREFLQKWQLTTLLSKNKRIKWIECDTLIGSNFLSSKKASAPDDIINYFRRLDFKKYDIIISDNLVEPIFFNHRVIIIGSFLWHDILKGKNYLYDYCRKCEDILHRHQPYFIANKYFAMPVFGAFKNVCKVGFIPFAAKGTVKKKNGNILLQVGNGSGSGRVAENFVKRFLTIGGKKEKSHLILDRRFKYLGSNQRLIYQDFYNLSFGSVLISVVRPGLGSITDNVTSLTPMMPLYFKETELKFNLQKCEDLGIGIRFSFSKMECFLRNGYNNEEIQRMRQNLKSLDLEGLKQSVSVIENILAKDVRWR